MTRSRWRSCAAAWGLLAGLVLGSGVPASAQPTDDGLRQDAPAATSSTWPWVFGILIGVGLGVLGTRMLSKRPAVPSVAVLEPEPEMPRPAAQNVPRENRPMSLPPVPDAAQTRPPGKGSRPNESVQERLIRKEMEQKPYQPVRSRDATENRPKQVGKPARNQPTKPPKIKSMEPTPADTNPDQPLQPGQTVELSPKPAAHEPVDATTTEVPIDRDAQVASLEALEAAAVDSAPAGPQHYYAPAPDVPSIEHRKLSPNPLPQMPLLVTLPGADATTAQFSFSPQADQSRIIGNGVRELKEFFQFELPPTEQFTTIQNLKPGTLEKRDDTWHVVDKATIALS